jgi:hypothetical protein
MPLRGNLGDCVDQLCGLSPHAGIASLCGMIVWSFACFLPRYLVAMNMTVVRVVVDAQEALAVWKSAFPALGRSLRYTSHHHSYKVELPNKEATELSSSAA